MHNHRTLELADLVERVATYGGPPMTFRVPEDHAIRLADRSNPGDHLLAGATISAWPASPDDVLEGRCE